MRGSIGNSRPFRNDADRVHRVMAAVVVVFDVGDVDSRRDAWMLMQIAEISREVRIVGDATEIAFEVSDINRIKCVFIDSLRRRKPAL